MQDNHFQTPSNFGCIFSEFIKYGLSEIYKVLTTFLSIFLTYSKAKTLVCLKTWHFLLFSPIVILFSKGQHFSFQFRRNVISTLQNKYHVLPKHKHNKISKCSLTFFQSFDGISSCFWGVKLNVFYGFKFILWLKWITCSWKIDILGLSRMLFKIHDLWKSSSSGSFKPRKGAMFQVWRFCHQI